MNDCLSWSGLTPFGARVDLDLSDPVSDRQIAALRQLFDRHHLLYFPDQRLSWERQSQVSSWLGPLVPEDRPSLLAPDAAAGGLGDSELAFHSDLSCSPEPLLGISLYAVEVDPEASPTLFVDAIAAVAGLPDGLRRRIAGLHAMNLWPMSLSARQRSADAPAGWPGARHPLLKPHPRTGEPILYLNASHTDRIVELAPEESEQVIQALFHQLYEATDRYEHHWRTGDFVIWDNLALQHARATIPRDARRTLQRVVLGSSSFADLMPPELLAAYASDRAGKAA